MNRFLKFYSSYFGEEITHINQLVSHKFDGEELEEFCTKYAEKVFEAGRTLSDNPKGFQDYKYRTFEEYLINTK